ncbi:MAG: hypothetical protein P1Q69_05345 [Candidatus Thorarchaeota archaeon]|nr:hypothetical protein [Candidatus Thorarchaeota archaeon]
MSQKRQYFEEPIVRVPIDKVYFPHICPICGKEAKKPARIIATPGKNRYLRPEWDPAFHPSVRKRQGIKPPEMKSLLLYVCDEHYKSDEGDTNYRLLCLIGNGLLGMTFLFALFTIGGSIWGGYDVGIIPYLTVLVFFISLAITTVSFRGGPLANAVKIVGFDGGIQNIWLQLKRRDYREILVEENAMHAELVSWIVKS